MMIMTTFLTITLSRLFLFLLIIVAFSSSIPDSYDEHCSSLVPQSSPTSRVHRNPVPYIPMINFLGGERLQQGKEPSSLTYMDKSLRIRLNPNVYATVDKGIYKVKGDLVICYAYSYITGGSNYSYGSHYHSREGHLSTAVSFELHGFWSESSRKLCMVGSASRTEKGDKSSKAFDVHDAVLKLRYASKAPTIFTSIVSGTLESTNPADDSKYFGPVSIISFPEVNDYNYSLVTHVLGGGLNFGHDIPKDESLVVPRMFCSPINLELEYAAQCKTSSHCFPLDASSDGFLPQSVSLNPIQCSRDERNIRYRMTFQNVSYSLSGQNFDRKTTFVAEGSWDDKYNRLLVVACRLLDPSDFINWSIVGDCALLLSLRSPSTWTIRSTERVVGQIWTKKYVNDSGINLKGLHETDIGGFPGLRYEYTELDRVRGLCIANKRVKKHDNIYPNLYSSEMKFDMSVKSSKWLQPGWGYVQPLFVEEELFDGNSVYNYKHELQRTTSSVPAIEFMDSSVSEKSSNPIVNISYTLAIRPTEQVGSGTHDILLQSLVNYQGWMVINAEGVYNVETGHLCMVGCRKLTNGSFDCEILVNIDFAPLNEGKSSSIVNGTIRSSRREGDPVYFEDLIILASAFSREAAEKTIWRMDLEITLVLISNTLICIFVGLQLIHAKRHPEVLHGISLLMLLILTFGLVIPLVLNFEALFPNAHDKHRVMLSTGGWVEAYEVTMRIVTLLALLLQLRLFQYVWVAKMSNENDSWRSWMGEKKAIFVSLPIYILGGLVTLLLHRINMQRYFLWVDLRSYFGLVLDGFLLPQIILNAFTHSAKKPLAHMFYIGISMVRVVPHVYDQYRAHNYPTTSEDGYFYANRDSGIYSTAWDVIIPCVVVVFAVIVFLQQRCGGQCILPQRLRELKLYEKVVVLDIE